MSEINRANRSESFLGRIGSTVARTSPRNAPSSVANTAQRGRADRVDVSSEARANHPLSNSILQQVGPGATRAFLPAGLAVPVVGGLIVEGVSALYRWLTGGSSSEQPQPSVPQNSNSGPVNGPVMQAPSSGPITTVNGPVNGPVTVNSGDGPVNNGPVNHGPVYDIDINIGSNNRRREENQLASLQRGLIENFSL